MPDKNTASTRRLSYFIQKFRLTLLLLTVCATALIAQSPKYEFRGVWIASVANIDWPSKPGLPSAEQQKEFIQILDMHKANGMNAVVVQIRPAADAFYPSRYEPWSKWLTGKLGAYPTEYYDPLKFMIDETHRRGMEFHAWFNPYRGIVGVDLANIDSASVAFQHPDWFVKYDKNLYFDPGLPQAQQHTTNVVLDVVNRYDVDGIHFDDYFYPYKVPKLDFPDTTSFKKYGAGFVSVDDWRRNNVDQLIKNISDSIRKVKPFVKFGISPFAVWRNQDKDPKGSATKAGQTCYDDLYADVLKWVREGWIDYVTPQIYWSIGFERADYKTIADWWNQNNHNVPVYVGQAAYRINSNNSDTTWKQSDQIPKQIRLNRSLANIQGSIFFSSKSFVPNPLGISDSLRTNFYKNPALIPSQRNEPFNTQYKINFTTDKNGIRLLWQEQNAAGDMSPHSRYVIYRFNDGEKITLSDPSKILKIVSNTNPQVTTTQWYVDATAKPKKKYVYVVTGINRYQKESNAAEAYPVKNLKKYWKTYAPIAL
jgi:uncharacterized lipoprotein YddW (UPF0748 family)